MLNFERRCWAEIDLDRLRHNFNVIQKTTGSVPIMAVVKANAYGHGDTVIVQELEKCGAQAFAVSGLNEAIRLRKFGCKKTILILGYTSLENTTLLAGYDITQAVYSTEYAVGLSEKAQQSGVTVKVHYKVDTGMGRIGFDSIHGAEPCAEEIAKTADLKGLNPTGIFTHFSVADSDAADDEEYTQHQYQLLCQTKAELAKKGVKLKCSHCCNSAGILKYGEMHLDMVRAGIILYGLNPSDEVVNSGLKPILKLKAVVSLVKTIDKGESVCYGRTFTAEHKMKVATIAIGYADGYSRAMSNKGVVSINNHPCKILGRVCMDQCVVDVTELENVKQGDIAIVYGGENGDSIDDVANKLDTINYEIICSLSERVQRVYIKNGEELQYVDYLL